MLVLISFSLVVFSEPPSISVAQQVVMVIAGEDASLECQASGTPPPLVKWQKGKYCPYAQDTSPLFTLSYMSFGHIYVEIIL